jgi:hypothetical protein
VDPEGDCGRTQSEFDHAIMGAQTPLARGREDFQQKQLDEPAGNAQKGKLRAVAASAAGHD